MPFRTLEDILSNTKSEKGPLETDCLIWQGKLWWDGYGNVWFAGGNKRVHRVVLSLVLNKPLMFKEKVCHKCDTPACANPEHLFIGSNKDNVVDSVVKGRRPTAVNEEQVKAIRTEYAGGGISMEALGVKYNIGLGGIHRIVHRRTWKHVE